MLISATIVEDNIYFAEVLSEYLSSFQIEVKKNIFSKLEAENILLDNPTDFLILDLRLSPSCQGEGLEILKNIRNKVNSHIIILTGYYDKELIIKAFDLGAEAYELKLNYENLPRVIKDIQYDTYPTKYLLQGYRSEKEKSFLAQFTSAERQLIHLLNDGDSLKDIFEKTYKSEDTIKNQIKSIKKKMGISSLSDVTINIQRFLKV